MEVFVDSPEVCPLLGRLVFPRDSYKFCRKRLIERHGKAVGIADLEGAVRSLIAPSIASPEVYAPIAAMVYYELSDSIQVVSPGVLRPVFFQLGLLESMAPKNLLRETLLEAVACALLKPTTALERCAALLSA